MVFWVANSQPLTHPVFHIVPEEESLDIRNPASSALPWGAPATRWAPWVQVVPNLLVPICFPVVNCMESLSRESVLGESKEEGKERLGVPVSSQTRTSKGRA